MGLYAPTMYLMAGLLVIGLICNLAGATSGGALLLPKPAASPGIESSHMPNETKSTGNAVMLLVSWVAVGVPLALGRLQNADQTARAFSIRPRVRVGPSFA